MGITLSFKQILMIIAVALILGLSLTTYWLYGKWSAEKVDKQRVENNFQNSQFKLDSTRTRNGQLEYSVKTLTLKQGEFETFAPDIVNQLKDMGLKVKNLESVVRANTRIEYLPGESIKVEVDKISPIKFKEKFKDKWLDFSANVNLINNKTDIKVDSFKLILTDTLLMPKEIEYKGWWFWKKAVNIKFHIQSKNPHFKVDRIESYDLTK